MRHPALPALIPVATLAVLALLFASSAGLAQSDPAFRSRRSAPTWRRPRSPACPPAPSWRASSISPTRASSSASASLPADPMVAPRPRRRGLRAGTGCVPSSTGPPVAAWPAAVSASAFPPTRTLEAQVHALAQSGRIDPLPRHRPRPRLRLHQHGRHDRQIARGRCRRGALCAASACPGRASRPSGAPTPSTPSSPRRRAPLAASWTHTFITDCDYDQAGGILRHIYPDVTTRKRAAVDGAHRLQAGAFRAGVRRPRPRRHRLRLRAARVPRCAGLPRPCRVPRLQAGGRGLRARQRLCRVGRRQSPDRAVSAGEGASRRRPQSRTAAGIGGVYYGAPPISPREGAADRARVRRMLERLAPNRRPPN